MINKLPPQGMRDFLPGELAVRNDILQKIKKSYAKFGFSEIETPCVDNLSLLLSKQGGENEKLIYKILKRGDKLLNASQDDLCDLGLRFDLTLPLARYCANNSGSLPPVFKAMQIGNVFRAERPQKGRFRQFIQCDIDIVGEDTIIAEIDLICATISALKSVGLKGFTVDINDRRILSVVANQCGFAPEMHEKVFIVLDKLDKIGLEGIKKELSEIADEGQISAFLSILDGKTTIDGAADGCFEQLNTIINTVQAVTGEKVVYNISLVRGMNYYTGAIFEVKVEGVPYSFAGGGRYDELLGKITGNKVPACGFSIGFERITQLLMEQGYKVSSVKKQAYIVGKEDYSKLTEISRELEAVRLDNDVSLLKKLKNFGYQIKSLKENGLDDIFVYEQGAWKRIE